MSGPSKKIVCRVRVDDTAKVVEFTWSEGSASFKPYCPGGRAGRRLPRQRPGGPQLPLRAGPAPRAAARAARPGLLPAGVPRPGARPGTTCTTRSSTRPPATASTSIRSPAGSVTSPVPDRSRAWRSSATASPGSPPGTSSTMRSPTSPPSTATARGLRGFAPFWGMRYNLCGGQPVDPLRRMPLPTKPQVLVVIDPVVLDDLRSVRRTPTARPSATGSSGSSPRRASPQSPRRPSWPRP